MNITINDLNQRMSFAEERTLVDEYGTPYGKEYVEFGSAWAHVSNLHGDEYYSALGLSLEKELKFTIRYRDDISEDTAITFRDNVYNITFIDNIRYRNRFMELRASLRGG
ncbi:phage head closure protein [Fundicoccus sp. Sow4_H7]|uniref:phage head closure protein n=1 Tax=Lactobacillales TaxID=186826 RepID=UPI00237D517B|nr:phage head closure protein [Jeotgalibaca caeni]MDE1547763.1 phage head closure protein [Jeotgalibaca caeni]